MAVFLNFRNSVPTNPIPSVVLIIFFFPTQSRRFLVAFHVLPICDLTLSKVS